MLAASQSSLDGTAHLDLRAGPRAKALPFGFTIQPAQDGGHFVSAPSILYLQGLESRLIVFAGDLDQCLAYVRKELAAAPPEVAEADR